MTQKFKKKWYAISTKYRIAIICAACLLVVAVPLLAIAGSGISFSGQTPNGTTTNNARPTISVKATASSGTINQEDISMTINDVTYTPSINQYGIISYKPTSPLGDGSKTVKVSVYDQQLKTDKTTTWNFTIDAAPNPSNWSPGKNATVPYINPAISLYVKDTQDNIDPGSLEVKIDGTAVTGEKFEYYTYDDYGSTVTNYQEGTITYQPTNLKSGKHTVEVSIKDVAGNMLTETWSFTIAEKPKFTNLVPADNAKVTSADKISVTVSDDTGVDWSTESIKLTVDKDTVTPLINQETGTISYAKAFADGDHTVTIEAKDIDGNLASKTWTFSIDSSAPNLDYLDLFDPSKTIEDGILRIRAGLSDSSMIKDNFTLSLDGTKLTNAKFWYDPETKNHVYLEYEGPVRNGNRTLSLYVEDTFGNHKTYTWNFTVSTKPVISEKTPIKYGVTDLTPIISATVKSLNGTINPDSIVLKLNGTKVDPEYDASVGKITYTPSNNLVNESYYTVDLTVADDSGATQTETWKFYNNNYADMSDSNVNNCTFCHQLASIYPPEQKFENIHANKLNFAGSHTQNQCTNCHGYISQEAGCQQCHGDLDYGQYEEAPHGSTPAIKYTATNFDTNFPLRITQNRELYDCVICHQPGAGTKGYEGTQSEPTRLLNNHDIPELHKTKTTDFDNCTKCHAKSLTREHAREGRVDNEDKAITCKTCHDSNTARAEVTTAVKAKDTSCGACHKNANHEELHTYSALDQNCASCHSKALSTEHDKRGFGCNTCHNSTKQNVNLALTFGQLSCSDCHTATKHGVTMENSVPTSLKYTPVTGTLKWMSPESLSFWAGESWIPADMVGGVMTVSSRNSGLSGTEVFNYYKTELDKLGWNKVSGDPGDKFELVYTKGKAKVYIRFYTGEHYDSNTLFGSEYGYRIEILYKYN